MTPSDEFLERPCSQHPPTVTPDYRTSVLRGTRATLFEDKLHGHG